MAFGIVKGLSLVLLAFASSYGYGSEMVQHIGSMMHGYEPGLMGALWGLLWGFICGFVFGFIFAAVYNFCLCYCHKFCSK
jgi:hypothetical protein